MASTAPTSPTSGTPAAALLSFMSATSNDIKEAMAKQSKRKVNTRNYIKNRVKRLTNSPPTGKTTKAKANKLAPAKFPRGPNSGPSTIGQRAISSISQRSTSWPLLSVEPKAYHGQHRGSLPTSELEGVHHTLYPAHAQKAMPIDSDLEKVLDVVDELESRSSSPQLDISDSAYSKQAFLGEYPLSRSPYSECSDELLDECCSASCSPGSAVGYADSPPTTSTIATGDWASGSSQTTCTSNWVPPCPAQTVYTTYAEGIMNTTSEWPVTSCSTIPTFAPSLPCASYSYDQNLPLTPTVSELWNSLAYGENF